MSGKSIIGLVLIVIGIFTLAYQGVTYKTKKRVLDIGPLEATKTENHFVYLPPVLGAIAMVAGVAVIVFDRRGNGS